MSGGGGNKGQLYTRTLRINSSNRTDLKNQTDSDFTVNLGNQLQQIRKLSVIEVSVPNIFYNVFESKQKYNNYFYMSVFDLGGIHNYVVRITPGFYTLTQLQAAISTAVT